MNVKWWNQGPVLNFESYKAVPDGYVFDPTREIVLDLLTVVDSQMYNH